MLRLSAALIFCLTSCWTFAQTAPTERNSSMPYPVANVYDTPEAADFAADFNVTDVGNLHVYDAELAEGTSKEYMTGVAVAPTNYRYLPKAVRRKMSTGQKAYAVHSIRGEAQSYFILKHPAVRKGVEYGLYTFDGENMNHLVDLAGYTCKGDRCTQMDSWIRDIDGDTRLDVIQKVRKPNGKVRMKVYQQTDGGRFKRDRSLKMDPVTYPMQERS